MLNFNDYFLGQKSVEHHIKYAINVKIFLHLAVNN